MVVVAAAAAAATAVCSVATVAEALRLQRLACNTHVYGGDALQAVRDVHDVLQLVQVPLVDLGVLVDLVHAHDAAVQRTRDGVDAHVRRLLQLL